MRSKIESNKHIQLLCDEHSFAMASFLYSYLLREHKKVSLCGKVSKRWAFLPWFEKLRQKPASSAEVTIDVRELTPRECFVLAKESGMNAKMATALYGAYFEAYEAFTLDALDGMIFAELSEIMDKGADHSAVREALLYSLPLCCVRLYGLLAQGMLLCENATRAKLFVDDAMLLASGADLDDAKRVAKEFLKTVHVREVWLHKSDEENKIVLQIKG